MKKTHMRVMSAPKNKGGAVRQLIERGFSNREIRERLGVSKATVSYHAKAIGKSAGPGWPKRDWTEVIECIRGGGTASDCFEKFGVHPQAFYSAVKAGIVPKPVHTRRKVGMTAAELGEHLTGKCGWSYRSRIKHAMLEQGVVKYACAVCGISEWRGQKLDLRLDHINGNSRDFF